MMKVNRIEIYDARFQDVTFSREGFMQVPIRVTRVGIFPYTMKDGSVRRELRAPEEVFSQESLHTLKNSILTNKHPRGMVDSKNASKLQIGFLGEQISIEESKFVASNAIITDQKMIDKITKKDNQQVSAGYTANVIDKSGIWNGQEYDAIQTDIRYNHVALVDFGRAGTEVKLKLDESDGIFYTNIDDKTKKEKNMKKIKIDGVEIEVSEVSAVIIEKFVTDQANEAKKLTDEVENLKKDSVSVKEIKSQLDKAEAKADSLTVKISELEKENKKDSKIDVHALVKERKNLEEVSLKVCSKIEKMDEMDNMTLKKHVVSSMLKDIKLDEKSEDYINASFETITNVEMKVDNLAEALKKKVESETKSDDNKEDSLSPEEKLQMQTELAYKNKEN